MNDIRSKFEEIWPVPDGVVWSMNIGAYVCNDAIRITQERINKCVELDARLDTFTRCQETTSIHLSLIEEMLQEIESCHADLRSENWYVTRKSALLDRAKQIMEQKK
jgi:hypothetical protein